MTIASGTRLGPYEILSSIGSGGMGEVYRARDARLDRFVAVKILPPTFADDPERVRRFEQEARAAAALSHPNILAVHDVGRHDGVLYLVAELLEGETLRERMADRPLPTPVAVEYAIQIAEALAAAHDKGIVHRDLKPENLFVTRGDRVKILDFGLARLRPAAVGHDGSTLLSGQPATEAGLVLGTAGYMAPEQVRGEPVDHRADIFALGAVVYEMLAGRRAFTGESAVETMAAILNEEPPELSGLQGPSVPVIDRIVRRCLDKRPERRFESARDLAFAFQALGTSSTLGVQADAIGRRPAIARPVVAVTILALVALVAWLAGRHSAPAGGEPAPMRRLAVVLPEGETVGLAEVAPLADGRTAIALSPDGARLAYVVNREGTGEVAVRDLNSFETRRLPGTEGAHSPFFSPDGATVAFFSGSALRRVAIEGGKPVSVAEARNPFGGVWLDDGTIVFADREGSRVVRVPAAGGAPQVVASAGQPTFVLYSALPGGRGILLGRWGSAGNDYRHVEVMSIETGERRSVMQGGTHAIFARSGHLVFLRGGTLHGVPFDLERLETRGDAVPLIGGVRSEQAGPGQVALARDGTLAYVEGSPGGVGTPVWVTRDGAATPVGLPAGSYGQLRLSPDGQRIAIEVQGAGTDIWVFDVARGAFTRLTQDGGSVLPLWTPDGRRLTFFAERNDRPAIVTRAADGSGGEDVLVLEGVGPAWSWSSDASKLAVQCGDGGHDICIVEPDGDRVLRPIVTTPFGDWGAAFSPDGRWIAYTSDVSGRYEVYVRPASGGPGQSQVSIAGGEEPLWSRDGRELFYRYGFRWMRVGIEPGEAFAASEPRLLFEGTFQNLDGFSHDVSPDGSRFLLVQSPDVPPATRIQIVLNWFEELRLPRGP